MSSRTLLGISAIVAVLLGSPKNVAGQAYSPLPPWVRLTGGMVVAQPVGSFARDAGGAIGWEAAARIPLDGSDRVGLRLFMGDMLFGWKREKMCGGGWTPCEWPEAWTTNSMFFGGIGPEVSFEVGRFRPYLNASVGYGQFRTTTSTRDWWLDGDVEEQDLLSDGVFTGGVGGGFDVALRGGRSPILLNLGAQYHRNGMAEYLTGSDVVHDPEGNVTLSPRAGPANFISYRIGITLVLERPGEE